MVLKLYKELLHLMVKSSVTQNKTNRDTIQHLNEVDEQAQHLLDTKIPPMTKFAGVTEQLKVTDQMKWVGLMNTVKAQVEEIIFANIIC